MELREQLQHTLGNAYTLERELGGGGMSRVFVAEEVALGRKVVVKVLPASLSGGVNIDRFKREIQVAARLQHAHIVPVLTAGETQGMPYYTMPFVEGESLRSRLVRGGALPITDTLNILRDVTRALAYAHEHGVVHRDIKPDNVMLSSGSAVVTDFGIAKAIVASRTDGGQATLTQIGTSIGTPAYMAPEQAAADPGTDHRADIYALGCTAYEMLTGRPPFVEKSPQQLLAAHMGKTPDAVSVHRPDTPALLATLVMRCLEKDAALRPASVAELARTFDTITSGGTHPAMPAILLGAPGALRRALLTYAGSFVAVAILAKAAIVGVGLPDWVFPGALIVMALGFPLVLFTGFVQRVTRHAMTATPTYTPGGTPSMASGGTFTTMAMKAGPHVSWRRTTIWSAAAVGAFVLLVTAFMTLRALGIGPAGSLLASGKLTVSDQILVADFAATGPDSALSGVLAEAMRSSLSRSHRVRIVQASTIAAALQRMERPTSSKVNLALAHEIAQREGVKAIIAGEVTAVSGGYLVTAKLLSAANGDVLTSFQESANGAADLIPAMDKLGRSLRSKIGESLRDVQGAPPLQRVATSSLDALRKFSEGAYANDVEGNPAKAVAPLEQAIALDSSFVMAYRKLAIALNNSGQRSRAADVIEMGFQLRDRAPEAERLALLGVYYMYGNHDDRAKAIDAYEQLFQRYPEWLAIITPDLLAEMYEQRREPARAESLWAIAIRAAPDENSPYVDIVRAQADGGRFVEAQRSLARARDHRPSLSAVPWYEGLLQYDMGNIDSARALFERNSRAPNQAGSALQAKFDLATLALVEGRLGEWSRLQADAFAQPGQPPAPAVETQLGSLIALRLLDRPDEARRRFDAFVARRPQGAGPNRPLNDALFEAQLGRTERAKALLAQYDAAVTDSVSLRRSSQQRHNVRGWLAVAEGRYVEAVGEFRAAEQLPDGPAFSCSICVDGPVGQAFDLANIPDSAIAAYEHFVKTPFFWRAFQDGVALAPILRRLGELYEAKGDGAKAHEYYARFVELWKRADPELQPKVAEIRMRLKRLEAAEKARR